ncbi:SRPBCC family protein [Filimonas effusa]|uniref:Polyketide cyclase n=1 Tax=Filimonas effusa TaxID=2508721 RepID=A0A4Q1DAI6_9BACT|nr:hypothetical protein [Filimonas effusa]RXK86424.1 hypothetical protein ESB13_06355 [Filimonas effusa]
MKLLKLALISFLVLFVVATLIGLMLPSTVVVSRAVDINRKDPGRIRQEINTLSRWPNWIEGIQANGFKLTSADSIGKGASGYVNGNNIQIIRATDTAIVSEWMGKGGFRQEAVMNIITNPSHAVTTVQWSFTQHIKWYPWERLGSMMNDKILGPVMEKSLANLKTLAENSANETVQQGGEAIIP